MASCSTTRHGRLETRLPKKDYGLSKEILVSVPVGCASYACVHASASKSPSPLVSSPLFFPENVQPLDAVSPGYFVSFAGTCHGTLETGMKIVQNPNHFGPKVSDVQEGVWFLKFWKIILLTLGLKVDGSSRFVFHRAVATTKTTTFTLQCLSPPEIRWSNTPTP